MTRLQSDAFRIVELVRLYRKTLSEAEAPWV